MELTRAGRFALNAVVALLYLFLLAPILIVVIAAFNSGRVPEVSAGGLLPPMVQIAPRERAIH